MDLRTVLLTTLRSYQLEHRVGAELAGFTWEDAAFFRSCAIRIEHGEDQAWDLLVDTQILWTIGDTSP